MKIKTFSRLHISLVSMLNSSYRINGGIGFSINTPSQKVFCSPATNTTIYIQDEDINLSLNKLINKVKVEYDLEKSISLKIDIIIHPHHGFGTGTALRLACLEALFIVNKKEYKDEDLIQLSGRGGTSGIGIHSYFSGGFIFDLGHKNESNSTLKPSHDAISPSQPLLLTQEEMPDWSIGICIPNDIKPLSHNEERAFFNKTCPLKKEAVYEASYHALFGTLAAVRTQDYDAFCLSIRNIQECDWKKAERNLHGKRLSFYEDQLYKAGADAVGMSSLGPALFFMAKDPQVIIDKLKNLPCQFYNAKMINYGRVISDV